MLDVTLEQIEQVLGEKGKKVGRDYVFQCKVCMDDGKNNLIFSPEKGLLKCFSCSNNEGGQYVLDLINEKCPKKNHQKPMQTIINPQPRFLDKDLQEQYLIYMCLANEKLLESQEMLNLLYEKRGIDRQTVIDCGIGYDDTEEHWVIPIFSLKYVSIMGFEYRRKNFDKYSNGSKVRRERGYITDICPVWGRNKAKTLIISEGFWDCYALHQYLRNKGDDDHTIYSCSNGVTSLVNVMNRITFANFNEVKLILDADEAGNKVTDEIINRYPFIKDKRGFLFKGGYKDSNEWLLATQEGR